MSENAKTIAFVLIGLVAVVIGIFSRPTSAEVDQASLQGTNLTATFKDPDAARSLRIVRFDEDTATLREFEVAEKDGLWSIPSKDGYPADAAKQMAEAATSLMDRQILDVASNNAGDHEQYGVIDPLSPKLEPGQKGVGTRVIMSDEQSKPLADLILGKSVRGAEGQRYVRKAGQDVVYIIQIDPAKLSTDFENWIEKDLLKLNAWDMQQVEVKDYSAEMQLVMGPGGRPSIGVAWDPRSDITVAYNDADAKWTPVKLRKFDPKQGQNGDYVDFTLAEDEELNAETLNALKTALDDLKIVDVKRKPQGLSDSLKAGEDFLNNPEALKDLMGKGFAATANQEGTGRDLISSDGEVIATMKNGTEYVLRFGNLTNTAGTGDKKDEAAAKDAADPTKAASADKDKKGDKSDVHRYLFAMARFNEKAIKQPELVKLPDLPPGATPPAPAAGAAPAPGATPAAPAPGATPPAAPAKEGEAPAEKKDAPAAAPNPSDEVKPGAGADADENTPPATENKDAAAPPADPAKAAATPADPAKPAEGDAAKKDAPPATPADGSEKKDDAAAKKEGEPNSEIQKVIAERERIEKENQRKLDEYQALVKKGQQNVKDLNARFGDWYFVVDDNVFQKVRVSSDKLIKKKEKKEDAAGATPGAPGAAVPPTGIPGLPSIPGATK